ncbi:MAG: glutamate 5-kinase [Spirochaetes bacterium]|nr:MAG: glutamate 5-kinase [Spirochaetota bacterium]
MPRKELLKRVNRIVVKVGTSSIVEGGAISPDKIARLAADIAPLVRDGYETVLVSSGAIGAGSSALGRKRDTLAIPEKQACAAVGQTILMNEYRQAFRRESLEVGQILLTGDDVKHRSRFLNARHTFNALFDMGVVPVVNENDTVAIEEIKFGDNDTLSAHVANIVEAELLVILSDVDGFYWDRTDAAPAELITRIDDEVRARGGGAGSGQGTGGMITKLHAAEIMIRSGEMMIIAGADTPRVVSRILQGENIGTLFAGKTRSLRSRKRWIAFNMKSTGGIVIDDGAVAALREKKKSLLATGVTGVRGRFEFGDAVEIFSPRDEPVGKGIVNYSDGELSRIRGRKSREIKGLLGGTYFDEVINRDDLIIY